MTSYLPQLDLASAVVAMTAQLSVEWTSQSLEQVSHLMTLGVLLDILAVWAESWWTHVCQAVILKTWLNFSAGLDSANTPTSSSNRKLVHQLVGAYFWHFTSFVSMCGRHCSQLLCNSGFVVLPWLCIIAGIFRIKENILDCWLDIDDDDDDDDDVQWFNVHLTADWKPA